MTSCVGTVLGSHGLESVGLVAGGHFAIGYIDDGEALRGSHTDALPPVAADGSAGDVVDALIVDVLVDVGVALEDADDVVPFEESEHLIGIGYGEGLVAGGYGRGRHVGSDRRHQRSMDGDEDGGGLGQGGAVGGE